MHKWHADAHAARVKRQRGGEEKWKRERGRQLHFFAQGPQCPSAQNSSSDTQAHPFDKSTSCTTFEPDPLSKAWSATRSKRPSPLTSTSSEPWARHGMPWSRATVFRASDGDESPTVSGKVAIFRLDLFMPLAGWRQAARERRKGG